MSTYCNRLQRALQNLLQHVVQFFHPRSSCTTTHISADIQRIMCRAWRSWMEEPNNSIYSAASLALRAIFSVSLLWNLFGSFTETFILFLNASGILIINHCHCRSFNTCVRCEWVKVVDIWICVLFASVAFILQLVGDVKVGRKWWRCNLMLYSCTNSSRKTYRINSNCAADANCQRVMNVQ